jgi:PAS domain-containing protein
MQFDWRTLSGPVLAGVTALGAVMLDRHVHVTPYLASLFVCIAAFSASLGGIVPGLISALFGLIFMAVFVLPQNGSLDFDVTDLARLAMLAAAAGGTAVITGLLRQRMTDALVRQRERHLTAERLSAALDCIDIGVVLLDADTRAAFINRAFRKTFSLPDAKADSKPPFIALMYHGRDTGAYEMPEDELSAFVAERMQKVRAGDQTPISLKLANGEVLRFSCTALPDGGRMLSYTPVTDLIRHGDDIADKERYLSMRGDPPRFPDQILRAAE